MSTAVLQYEVTDRVAWITLDRPDQLNALSTELKEAIVVAAADAATDPEVWIVVVRGAGQRAFSVGGDLKERGSGDDVGARPPIPMLERGRNVYEAVLEIPKPTIAIVQGYALGGGFELALACDLRVAAEDAVFGMPESKVGMGANFGSVLLPRLLPRALALEMLYFGERFTAQELLARGLLNKVWPAHELADRAAAWIADLGTRAPLTLARYKEMAVKGWELPVATNLRLGVGPNPYTSEDRIEGTRAFREKRKPVWRGR